jgi:MFS family permease
VTLVHVMILATLLGLTAAFDIPGRQAFVGELVAKRDLMSAVALNSASFNSSRVIGPAVAGVIIGVAGVGVCFLLNGISYLALIGALLVMRLAPQPRSGDYTSRSTVWEGLTYVMRDRNMRTLVLMIAIASIFGLPFYVLLPVLARNVMGLGATEFGWMVSASAGGAVVAALGLATLGRRIPKGRVVTIAAPLFGIAVASLGITRSLGALLPLLVVTGFFQVVLTATTNTMLQSLVKDELRGRVMSVYALAFLGLMPLGTLVAGIVAERWGAGSWLIGSGLLCTGLVLIVPRMAPSLRAAS